MEKFIEEKKAVEIPKHNSKNLFDVNKIKYSDNMSENIRIGITESVGDNLYDYNIIAKEQYCEYMQQKELIEKQQKEIEILKDRNNKMYEIIQEIRKQDKYTIQKKDLEDSVLYPYGERLLAAIESFKSTLESGE